MEQGYNSDGKICFFMKPYNVKIEFRLVQNIDEDINLQKLLQKPGNLFQGKKKKIIAEGVETVNELRMR